MEFLRTQLNRITQQLKGLSASQRMLAGALTVIIVMTLYWWGVYAARSDMEPVLDQSLTAENIRLITMQLKGQGITSKIVGDRVYVPVDRKEEALVGLAVAQVLPEDTKDAFDDIVAKSNPFTNGKMQDALFNKAKQAMLSRYIGKFPGVQEAMVFIEPTRERGPNGTMPTASIFIKMKRGQTADRKLAESAADLVCGAANLTRERINVVIDGVSSPLRPKNGALGGDSEDYLARVRDAEQYYHTKLLDHIGHFIQGATVAVTVSPNIKRSETVKTKWDKNDSLIAPAVDETNTDETRSSQPPAAEPGVISNSGTLAADSANAAGDGTASTTEKSRTENFIKPGGLETKTWDPGGDFTVTGVSVIIPRSHFVRAYKQYTNTDTDPAPQVLDDYIKAKLLELKPNVRSCLPQIADDAVRLAEYVDLVPTSPAETQTATASVTMLLGGHMKEIALGVLALASLLIVSQVVRKSAPAPVVAQQQHVAKVPQPLPIAEEAVGEAAAGTPMLDGMEVDEDSVKAQQMLGQVSEMVEENPDAAAALVKRWLNRA